jgi:hypothetical protein
MNNTVSWCETPCSLVETYKSEKLGTSISRVFTKVGNFYETIHGVTSAKQYS